MPKNKNEYQNLLKVKQMQDFRFFKLFDMLMLLLVFSLVDLANSQLTHKIFNI